MTKHKDERAGREDTAVHYYNPDAIEEVIELHRRHQRHSEKILTESTEEDQSRLALRRGSLGLHEAERDAITRQAAIDFFGGAKLSEELREERQRFRENADERLLWFRKDPASETRRIAELHALLFSRQYEAALKEATGDFADMLTSAVIARRGRKDFSLRLRTLIWAECLEFAMKLKRFEAAGAWIDRAWGDDPRESPLPHLSELRSLAEKRAEAAKFSEKFRAMFEERIRHASPSWLNEADRRIELRCLLSGASQHRMNPTAPSTRAVWLLLSVSPELTTEQVCGKLDVQNERFSNSAPLLEVWRNRGARSWTDAFAQFRGRVKTYVSNVRKRYGIAKTAPTGS